MTFEENNNASPASPVAHNGSFQVIDFSTPARDKPMVHPAVDPPLCETCHKMELQFFDPNCPGCQDLLTQQSTAIAEIFAILRQWTPQTQQNLEILVREILRRGAHVDDRDGLTDMTLLHYVAKAGAQGVGDVEEACRMVNLLLSKGADVYVRCRWTHMTALHYAAYFDVAPAIMNLLKATKGVDVDSRCSEFDNGTPLHISAANLAFESARVLLQNSADPQLKDELGRTPLDCVPDPANFSPDTEMGKLVAKLHKLLREAEPVVTEMMLTDQDGIQSQEALRTVGVRIGDKVMVGGVKSGMLRYCGPTEFASGLWAGIELDEAAGKNDGSVAGVAYFRCPPKYGIFAPVSKLTKPGLIQNGQRPASAPNKSPTVTHPKVDTSRVTAKVDTGLARGRPQSMILEPSGEDLQVGDKVIVAGQRRGVLRYSGETDFAPGLWYGIELDKAVGRNDGSVNGRSYFTCRPKHGVFAPPSRVQRCSELQGCDETSDSFAMAPSERLRRLSAGSAGSQQSLNGAMSKRGALARAINVKSIKSLLPEKLQICPGSYIRPSLHSISERTVTGRPKSSGSVGLMKRSFSASATTTMPTGQFRLTEGMSVFCNNELGVVRYIGPVDFAEGVWLGVELRTPKGKNDGSVQGKRYFTCKPQHGLIVRPSKVTVRGINGAKLLGDQHPAAASPEKAS